MKNKLLMLLVFYSISIHAQPLEIKLKKDEIISFFFKDINNGKPKKIVQLALVYDTIRVSVFNTIETVLMNDTSLIAKYKSKQINQSILLNAPNVITVIENECYLGDSFFPLSKTTKIEFAEENKQDYLRVTFSNGKQLSIARNQFLIPLKVYLENLNYSHFLIKPIKGGIGYYQL